MQLRAGSATDVGLVRSNNQDQFLLADRLYAVADGMGGAAAGEVASAIAVESLGDGFSRHPQPTADDLIEAAREANRAVFHEAEAHPQMRGMGTTLVALALVDGGHQMAIVNIGDSRLYVLRAEELRQVTSDHNLVAEMVAEGRISKEEAEVHPRRNIMTRALGVEPDVPVDLFVEKPSAGDRYLLCSDGLSRELSDDTIASLLRRLADPEEAAKELVEEAKRHGGNDNITVVVVDVVDAEGLPAGVAAAGANALETPGANALETAAAHPPAPGTGAHGNGPGGVAPAADLEGAADATLVLPPAAGYAATPAPGPGPVEVREEEVGRRRFRRPQGVTRSPVTFRVIGFVLLLLLVLGAGAAGIVLYARSAYFVGLRGAQIVIFQGRPNGVLWLEPTVADATTHTTADVLPVHVPTLQGGQQEPTLNAARAYVASLIAERRQALAAAAPPPPTSSPVTPAANFPSVTTRPPAATTVPATPPPARPAPPST